MNYLEQARIFRHLCGRKICETHDGTLVDPIPYEGSMALENGKYYSQDGVTYLCNRDTVNPVYNPLSEMVGIYNIHSS